MQTKSCARVFEVFTDTIVICTLTALVILCSGVPVGYGAAAGAELTISGFTSTYGKQEYCDKVRDRHQTVEGLCDTPEKERTPEGVFEKKT